MVPIFALPNQYDRTGLIAARADHNEPPGKTPAVSGSGRSLTLCPHLDYPRYKDGPPEQASFCESSAP